MLRLIKWVLILAVLGLLVVSGYTVIGDFSAPSTQTTQPVTIKVD